MAYLCSNEIISETKRNVLKHLRNVLFYAILHGIINHHFVRISGILSKKRQIELLFDVLKF